MNGALRPGWALTLLLMACPADPPATDAGPPLIDAGRATADAADLPPLDAGHWSCPQGCDEGWQCVDDQCRPPEECGSDTDCQLGQSCSQIQRCHDEDCLVHQDCAPEQRCRQGVCLARPEPGFVLERVYVPTLEAQISVFDDPCDREGLHVCTDVGFGLALLDFDGDQDLDLFVGQAYNNRASSPACLYRNQSTAGRLSFVPIPSHCAATARPPTGGQGMDIDGDGRHELLLFGPRLIELHRFHPSADVIDLLALLPPDDERAGCNAGAAVSYDFTYDGLPDLLVGCQFDTDRANGTSLHNLAFAGEPNGGFRFIERDEWNGEDPLLLEALGSTLAIGAADLNGDGLLDLLVSEDEGTAVPELYFENRIDPGGIYLRCPPTQDCRFTAYRLGESERAFGGYMGTAVMQLDGVGEVSYFSNTGNNRMIELRPGQTPIDRAASSGTLAGSIGAERLFSWGAVVDDFNRDGRDDFMLAQGAVWLPGIDSHATHFDALFLQTENARFNLHGADLGLTPFTHQDSRSEARVYASRALLKADLDGDGHLDFLSAGKEGALRWHREVPTRAEPPPRCTLIPKARYSPAFGVGHALLPPGESPARQWDSQGQLRSGASPFVVSPWNAGTLRFPSGGLVPFDCQGRAGPVAVVEPEWLAIDRQGPTLIIQLGAEAPETNLTAIAAPSRQVVTAEDRGAGSYRLTLPPNSTRVMLRFGERWVPRWWEL